MIINGLNDAEAALIIDVLRKNPGVEKAFLFGSRAMGNHRPNSDVDIAVDGLTDSLHIEALARDLDELPLPYKFDVKGLSAIKNAALRLHIERVGKLIFERNEGGIDE